MMNRILLAICCLFISFNVFAQSPKAIEADLLKSFKKIGYWVNTRIEKRDKQDAEGAVSCNDSIEVANDLFRKKLNMYATKYPGTIIQPFASLKKERLDINTSSDQLLRIYTWDTWQGGTMRDFNNIFQYKINNTTYSIVDTAKDDHDYVYNYETIHTFKTATKTYYLAVYLGVFSSKDIRHGIRVFAIEDGKLNKEVKVIKTATGLHDRLFYDYDFSSVVDWKENGKVVDWEHRPRPTFDSVTQTIKLPLVDAKDQVTRKFITYKFNGKYFEKVKS